MADEDPRPLEYATPVPGYRRQRARYLLQFVSGLLLAIGVVLLLIPFTGEGPMVPAVLRAVATVVGPAAAVLLLFSVYAHRRLGWRGFTPGVLVGLLTAGLVAGLCVPMMP